VGSAVAPGRHQFQRHLTRGVAISLAR
jgi:hypothetical protein